jgi:putative oxidoreductase
MEFLQDLFALLGRILISGTVLWGVYEKLRNWPAAVNTARSRGTPHVSLILPIGVGLKILGSLLVLFGWYAHVGALLLLIVAIPYTYWMHPFWKLQGNDRMVQEAVFRKEVMIVGGLLILLAMGGGHFGISG